MGNDKGKPTCPVCGKEFKDKSGLAGHMQLAHPSQEANSEGKPGAPKPGVVAKRQQSPLEQLIKDLELPSLVDGQAEVFDAGVQYGVRSVLVGVRVAQELSAMGVQQAVPVINMAREMRESEGQAAKIIAGELAAATLEGNKDVLEELRNLKLTTQAGSTNPMQRMIGMMQSIPQMMTAASGLMGMFGMKPAPQQGQPQQGQPQQGQPAQFKMAGPPQPATDRDIKEAFGKNREEV